MTDDRPCRDVDADRFRELGRLLDDTSQSVRSRGDRVRLMLAPDALFEGEAPKEFRASHDRLSAALVRLEFTLQELRAYLRYIASQHEH